jgi:hypothetical protein
VYKKKLTFLHSDDIYSGYAQFEPVAQTLHYQLRVVGMFLVPSWQNPVNTAAGDSTHLHAQSNL